jgi:hypothetical protein
VSRPRGTRGAIYVEFLLAFLPLFVLFLGIVQLFDLNVANVIANHAVQLAARTAAVVLHDDPSYYDGAELGKPSGKRRDAVMSAAQQVLKAARSVSEVKVSFPDGPGSDTEKSSFGRDDLVRVRLDVRYQCRVPLVARMVCDAQTTLRTLRVEAALPNQGADYAYP